MISLPRLLVFLTITLAFANPSSATAQKIDSTTLNSAMQEQIDSHKVSGVVALISHKNEIVYHEALGHRVIGQDDAPMQKDTLFRIFSMTKPIVAAAAMSVWEEGKFQLDDPISKHLSEWKSPKVRSGKGEPAAAEAPITPRQLMTHSSGITYGKEGLKLDEASTLEEFSSAIASRPLKFQPGSEFVYGYSIDILGRYLEEIEGKTLDVILQERIFAKLKMNDTGFWVRNPNDRSRVAMAYSQGKDDRLVPALRGAEEMRKPEIMYGGHGLISTSGDYAKFCAMLSNGGEVAEVRVLKEKSIRLMFENHLKDIGKSYGLGGKVGEEGKYSWGGAAGTQFWVHEGTGSYGVFMIQTWGYTAPTFNVFIKQLSQGG